MTECFQFYLHGSAPVPFGHEVRGKVGYLEDNGTVYLTEALGADGSLCSVEVPAVAAQLAVRCTMTCYVTETIVADSGEVLFPRHDEGDCAVDLRSPDGTILLCLTLKWFSMKLYNERIEDSTTDCPELRNRQSPRLCMYSAYRTKWLPSKEAYRTAALQISNARRPATGSALPQRSPRKHQHAASAAEFTAVYTPIIKKTSTTPRRPAAPQREQPRVQDPATPQAELPRMAVEKPPKRSSAKRGIRREIPSHRLYCPPGDPIVEVQHWAKRFRELKEKGGGASHRLSELVLNKKESICETIETLRKLLKE
jgi:hypothetical protein